MTKFVNATLPQRRWSMETILESLDRRMFVDVHPCLTLSLKPWAEPMQNGKVKNSNICDFSPLKGDAMN